MFKATKGIVTTVFVMAFIMLSAAVTFAQTTGSVTMTATVSNFVELTSGGAVSCPVERSAAHSSSSSSRSP